LKLGPSEYEAGALTTIWNPDPHQMKTMLEAGKESEVQN
jgi:hypothetical protein